MKEIKGIIDAYNSQGFKNNQAALVTVVGIRGSSYRRVGARMLVLDNGMYYGGISGGCLEGDALRRAQKAIYSQEAALITYDTTQQDGHAIGAGLGCNGIIDVLISPLNDNAENPVELLKEIAETREARILISIIESNKKPGLAGKTILFRNPEKFLTSFPVKEIASEVLSDINFALRNEVSKSIAYTTSFGEVKIFLEIILPSTHLIIYGGNDDVIITAGIAKELGWTVSVITNLVKANKELAAKATRIIDHKTSGLHRLADRYSAVVLMAHDYKMDLNNLKAFLKSTVSYIGLLGPRSRFEKMRDELATSDFRISEEDMQRIYAPCGLDIGAANPQEIALSIAAEIKAHFAGREGMPLKLRKGTIYEN